MPSAYQLFVKRHMLELRDSDMKNTEKFKHIALLWKKYKENQDSESDSVASEEHNYKQKKQKSKSQSKTKPKRKTKSKDVDLSELLEILGK